MKSINKFFNSNLQALQTEELPVRILEYWANALHFWGRAWWIEISTSQPSCLYYFGPFPNSKEAERLMAGYVEDLESESAQGIQAKIKRCKPNKLTIEGENGRHDQQYLLTLPALKRRGFYRDSTVGFYKAKSKRPY